jgi:hypothetical protein
MLRVRPLLPLLSLLGLTLIASPAIAVNVDFEQFSNGEAGPFAIPTPFATVSITPDGPPPGDHIGLAIFDSDFGGPNDGLGDQDLVVDSGNILILQNNELPTQTIPGFFDTANDDEDGGNFNIMFDQPVFMNSIELIDINGGGMLTVSLFDQGGNSRVYDVPNQWTGDITQPGQPGFQVLDLTTLLPQLGVGPGGNATAAEFGAFDPTDVINVAISFSGSAAIDNINFVPEPGTALLVGLGLGALGLRRRRA